MRSCNPKSIRTQVRFSAKNPLAVTAARQNAARMVTDITLETRRALAAVIQRAVSEGIPPTKVAKMIRPMIGLTRRQAMAVMNAQSAWEAAGLSGDVALRRAEAYAAKLLAKRAEMIARTEIIQAVNAGQLNAWRQAAEQGLLQRGSRRVWIAERDACERCRGLHKKSTGLEGMFAGGVAHPPLHPSCRCTVELVVGRRVPADIGLALVS